MATMTLRERAKQLEASRHKIDARLSEVSRDATMRAVEKATELTPPTQNDLTGTNTRSGEMKQHWATDRQIAPQKSGSNYITTLANDKEYASYVNDGHRMDRHFVPGLYINPYSGLLEYDPSRDVGIVVGTKTAYVPGLFMVEKAKETYSEVIKTELADFKDLIE